MVISESRKEYLRKYHREYYKIPSNRLKRLDKERIASTNNKEKYKEWKETLKCSICEENSSCCLEMHHKDPKLKDFSISKMSNKRFERIICEAEKCICLCSNCHKKVHAGILNVDDIELYVFSI